jgi:hypothetical protein
MAEAEGYKPKENWYVTLWLLAIGELKKEIGEKKASASPIRYLRNLGKPLPKKTLFSSAWWSIWSAR